MTASTLARPLALAAAGPSFVASAKSHNASAKTTATSVALPAGSLAGDVEVVELVQDAGSVPTEAGYSPPSWGQSRRSWVVSSGAYGSYVDVRTYPLTDADVSAGSLSVPVQSSGPTSDDLVALVLGFRGVMVSPVDSVGTQAATSSTVTSAGGPVAVGQALPPVGSTSAAFLVAGLATAGAATPGAFTVGPDALAGSLVNAGGNLGAEALGYAPAPASVPSETAALMMSTTSTSLTEYVRAGMITLGAAPVGTTSTTTATATVTAPASTVTAPGSTSTTTVTASPADGSTATDTVTVAALAAGASVPLDGDQFGVIGIGVALGLMLLASLAVTLWRR